MSEPGALFGSPDAELDDLFDHAPFGYLAMAVDGRIVRANATLAGWLGFEAQALVGRRFRDLLTVPARIFYETNFAPLLRLQDGFEEVALDLLTAAGEKLPVLINVRERRDADGRPLALRVAVMRAKDRRGYERDLRGREAAAAQRLADEQATAELREQFIAVLGHDLRNPLASLVGAARLLRREALGDKAQKVLDLMDTSVDRMAGLIDDVMDFARGRLGDGIVVERVEIPLAPVLRQVIGELEVSAPSRQIETRFHLAEPVCFDAGRIGQLVSNLLGNALAHGDPRRPILVEAITEDSELRICVANAGTPIPPAAMERLFQPFFRGEVRPSQQGLGLGLHIASEIARAHGGRIEVCSDDQETRFTLVMPCQPPPA